MPKRKRSNGSFQRAAKRFKSRRKRVKAKRAMRRQGRAPTAIERPRKFHTLLPRVYTTHKNKLSVQFAVPAVGFKSTSIRLLPGTLRDPHAAVGLQPFPENFVTMASLYRSYRVNAVTVHLSYHALTNNENAKFWSCVYSSSADNGIADPFPPASVASHGNRDAFLQQTGIRKKMIASSGTTGGRKDNIHNAGTWSIAGIEQRRRQDMDDVDYAGHVNVGGGTAGDPNVDPNLWLSTVSPNFNGFPGADTYDISVTLIFHVEWFNLRESLEADQGEIDP